MSFGTVRAHLDEPELDKESAVAALLYLAGKMERTDFHSLFKALYVADTKHLENYGRMIAWDHYHAFDYGPVPLTIYNTLRFIKGDRRFPLMDEELYHALKERVQIKGRYILEPLEEPDLGVLSRSEIRCLDEAAAIIDSGNFKSNTDRTHDDAYDKARERQMNGRIRLDDILEAVEEADEIREYINRRER